MATVKAKNVSKIFPNNIQAVKDISLEVADKEFLVIVGPSGCGKSTFLRLIAGLEEIASGEIYINDKLVNNTPPKDRNVAMVFQNYALYPHMDVYNNMAFGLKLRRYPKKEIDKRVNDAAVILGLKDLLDRRPRMLSGGQRQRVAVGRAIVRKPHVFLFDEPLSNLDAKLRVQMRTEIRKLHNRLQATMIYVTHDQTEAMTMGDRIVILKDGLINQIADPITIYFKPVNKFVAGFIGSPPMNFMEGGIIKKDGDFYFDEGNFRVKVVEEMVPYMSDYQDKAVSFGVRPEDIYDKLFTPDASPENTLAATCEVIEPMGSEVYLHLTTGKHNFIARMATGTDERAEIGQDIDLVFDMSKVHFFDSKTQKTII